MSQTSPGPSARPYRVLAAVATVPILALCALVVWALVQFEKQDAAMDGAGDFIIWPISFGALVLALLAVALRAPRAGAGCVMIGLMVLAAPATGYLAVILSQL